MSQLTSTLREAADKNLELLTELAATDYAPSSLKQNGAFIDDIRNQIINLDAEIRKLHAKTEAEKKEHVDYRDSNVKKFMYGLRGSRGKEKFAAKSEKEEREFMEAWQNERSAQDSRDELQRTLELAEEDRKHLEADAARQEKAQKDLDELYASIFSGPTPEVPGEDMAEDAVNAAKANLEVTSEQLKNDKAAMDYLVKCQQCMKTADAQMDQALKYSYRDGAGGGLFTDLEERAALEDASNFVQITKRHLASARRYQPEIQDISSINIDNAHATSDILFDCYWTDRAQHERIMNAKIEMVRATDGLGREVKIHQGRVQGGEAGVKDASARLEAARRELQRIRGEAFERLAANGFEAPPAYVG